MVYTFVNKTFSGCGVESEIMPNQELAEAIHKLVIRNLKNKKNIYLFKEIFGLLILLICN